MNSPGDEGTGDIGTARTMAPSAGAPVMLRARPEIAPLRAIRISVGSPSDSGRMVTTVAAYPALVMRTSSGDAAGMTIPELEEKVRTALLTQLKRPKVAVSLVKLAVGPRVTVIGAVEKPGQVELQEGLRVRKAVELAGGAKQEADLGRVDALRVAIDRALRDRAAGERMDQARAAA